MNDVSREVHAVAAIGTAILELSQIGTLEDLTAYPVSAHARVTKALDELRQAQQLYLPEAFIAEQQASNQP